MEQNFNHLNAIEKTLKILTSFDAEHTFWGVRELSSHLGFSPATVQRILQTLKQHDFVAQDAQTRRYRLGSAFWTFTQILQQAFPLIETARPFMQQLLLLTQETVHLNVIENFERVCIDSLESPQRLKAGMPAGSRSPLYAGASSKCLLAFASDGFVAGYLQEVSLQAITPETITHKASLKHELANIRRAGFAASLGERNPGLGSLSAPVINHQHQIVASLSLALPALRYQDADHRTHCLNILVTAARDFSRELGHSSTQQGGTDAF